MTWAAIWHDTSRRIERDDTTGEERVWWTDGRLTDLTERVSRIEAKLWPAPPAPTNPDDPAVADWAGFPAQP